MFYNRLNIVERQLIFVFKVDTPFASLDCGMFGFEGFNVMISAGVERDIVFLIGDGHPALALSIGGHLVAHVDRCSWE